MQVFYSHDYTKSSFNFDTTRKAGPIAASLKRDPIDGAVLVAPRPLTVNELLRVHTKPYIDAVRTGRPRWLAESNGFDWDPRLFPMVQASNGGAVASAFSALQYGVSGSLSSGLHHARHDSGRGFCTFNGLALAAVSVLDSYPKSKILILDLDAHCGGGTQSIIGRDPRICQVDISVSSFDSYAPTFGSLDIISKAKDYLPCLRRRLKAIDSVQFDLCIYNAGMDPMNAHGINGGILMEREEYVFQWFRSRNIPISFVLAGGYLGVNCSKMSELVDLHRLTLSAAAA